MYLGDDVLTAKTVYKSCICILICIINHLDNKIFVELFKDMNSRLSTLLKYTIDICLYCFERSFIDLCLRY